MLELESRQLLGSTLRLLSRDPVRQAQHSHNTPKKAFPAQHPSFRLHSDIRSQSLTCMHLQRQDRGFLAETSERSGSMRRFGPGARVYRDTIGCRIAFEMAYAADSRAFVHASEEGRRSETTSPYLRASPVQKLPAKMVSMHPKQQTLNNFRARK